MGAASELSERLAVHAELDVSSLHDQHANFVWLSLQRLGIREADLEDMTQEVFMVVHRNLRTFNGSAKVTMWLFAICMRVASGYRRKAYMRREQLVESVPVDIEGGDTPEQSAVARQGQRELERLLDELDLEKRAVLVMFEIDELSCEEIAVIVGAPVGTVYSRLHAARQSFEKAVARKRARDARGGRP